MEKRKAREENKKQDREREEKRFIFKLSTATNQLYIP